MPVLVVDDDDAIRAVVAAALAFELGVRVFWARDGAHALARVGALGPPALVVTDLRMPVLDGYGLIRALRSASATARVPIVGISAAGEEQRALAAGCDAFLAKPFDVDELVRVVRRLLETER